MTSSIPRSRLVSACHATFAAVALVSIVGCTTSSTSPSAGDIINRAIEAHGGEVLDNAVVSFRFRDDRYRLRQTAGRYHYRRIYSDSLGRAVTDGLTNSSLYRVVEGDTVSLSPEERASLRETVNSVRYFALLPEPLENPAVQPTYAGRDTIDGVAYHRVRVTFRKEGGGEDWQDIFMYWFRTDGYTMDYLAYAYGLGPDEEAGTRFRKAYNVRRIGGVRFADYSNYTLDSLSAENMRTYPDLLARDSLRLVSRIELDSVEVRPLEE